MSEAIATTDSTYRSDMDANELLAICEAIVSDDESEEIQCALVFDKPQGTPKMAAEKISRLYTILHSHNLHHSCHGVHTKWREQK